MPIFVRMFDDRLVVESPGPFPPFVTPSNIYDTHNPRNPYLIEAMRRLDYTKCAHEGTRRMKLSMELMKLPDPEFRQVDVDHPIVRVTLRNNAHQRKAWVDRDVVELIGVITAKTLNANDKRIVNFVAEHDEISVSDAVRILGGDWRTNKRRLMRLVAREILVRVGRPGLRPDQRDPTVRFKLNRE